MPKTDSDIRDEYIDSLNHIRSIIAKLSKITGKNKALMFTDNHKIFSGLLLSAYSGFEYATRAVFILDVSNNVNHPIRRFTRTPRGHIYGWHHLAEQYFTHPDQHSFYSWDYDTIMRRAKENLPTGHRFNKLINNSEFLLIRRLRNSIAHGTDKAHDDFMKSVSTPPLSLTSNQRKGITPKRFLASKRWGGTKNAIEVVVDELEKSIRQLIP